MPDSTLKRRPFAVLITLAILVACLAVAVHHWRRKGRGAVQRGWDVAETQGCFACHGAGGYRGMPDPGHGLEDVPPWSGGMITMYAKNEDEIREWILDGMPRRVREDPEQRRLRDHATILMPAWRGRIGRRDLADLVAYVKAVSDFDTPQDEPAEAGRQVALRFGCFNCHGPQGRGAMPNPGALKGYVPSWDGNDFEDLAANDQEIREWILEGRTRRLRSNRLAQWFLNRQRIQMPAYRGHVSDEEVSRIVDYIHWLRPRPK